MARVELPQSKLRKRKRRRRFAHILLALLSVILLVGGAAWLSRAPFLEVRAIEIGGNQSISSSTVEAYARESMSGAYWWLFARDNIFLYPKSKIARGLLASHPALRAVEVHAKDFNTVSVNLIEREPVALWCDGACYYLDETGLAYAQAPSYSEPIFVSYHGALAASAALPRQYLTETQFQSLFALVSALNEADLGVSVESLDVDSFGDVRAMFAGGFTLIWSDKDNGGDIFERFKLALESEPFKEKSLSDFEYLDLRWGERLYYKAK